MTKYLIYGYPKMLEFDSLEDAQKHGRQLNSTAIIQDPERGPMAYWSSDEDIGHKKWHYQSAV